MDVMALDKAGIPNAVALMGTQLTPEQINLLKRLRCEIRIGLDGDLPGQMAAMRTAGLLFKNGIPVRVVDYEGDLRDPDDILQEEGPEGLRAKMEHLVDPIEFSLAYYTSTKKLETAAERKAVLSKFLPYLRAKPAGIEYEDMLVKIAHATSYEPEAIRALAKSAPKEEGEDPFVFVKEKGRAAHKTSRLYSAERMLLYYMLQEREALAFYESSVRSFRNSAYEEAANYIIEYEKNQESPGKIDLGSLIAFIESYGNGDEAGTVVSELAFEKNYPPYSLSALEDCLKAMKEEGTLTAEQMAAKRKIEEGTLEQGAEANKELAEKIRAKWNKKGAHHG